MELSNELIDHIKKAIKKYGYCHIPADLEATDQQVASITPDGELPYTIGRGLLNDTIMSDEFRKEVAQRFAQRKTKTTKKQQKKDKYG